MLGNFSGIGIGASTDAMVEELKNKLETRTIRKNKETVMNNKMSEKDLAIKLVDDVNNLTENMMGELNLDMGEFKAKQKKSNVNKIVLGAGLIVTAIAAYLFIFKGKGKNSTDAE